MQRDRFDLVFYFVYAELKELVEKGASTVLAK
jgi:hypothetical protein